MNRILITLVKMNGLQLLKKPKLLLSACMMPLVILLAVHFTLAETVSEVRIPIIVVNEDQSETSQEILRTFEELDHMIQLIESTMSQGTKRLLRGEADAIIYLEEGFEEKIFAGDNQDLVTLIHTPSSLSAGLLREVVASEVMRYVSNSSASHYLLPYASEFSPESLVNEEQLLEETRTYANEQWNPSPPLDLKVIGDHSHFREWEEGREFITTEDIVKICVLTLILLFPLTFTTNFIGNRKKDAFNRLVLFNVGSLLFALAHAIVITFVVIIMSIPLLLLTHQLYPESLTALSIVAILSYIIFSTFLSTVLGLLFKREQLFLFTVLVIVILTVVSSILLTGDFIESFYYSFISPQFIIINIELYSTMQLLVIIIFWAIIAVLISSYPSWRERVLSAGSE
ncbi:ABC transporter permease [Salipaludibacillus sp. CF4.18]|uniref:ABC transporter permease n=1 Tax=Salipaludibacillus sp. CF4.18 TaxID=3373081 RepID=UPI003EE7F72B